MKDIAERVGVSKMAVSSVLSGSSRTTSVSEATRERILTAARQLRYRPNAIARSLRSKRTNIIGFYSGYRFIDPRNAFFAEIVGGLQEGCTEHRKDLLLHTVFREESVEDIYAELADGRIDGLVLTAPPDDPLVGRLADSHLPVVVVADAVPTLPSVIVDDAQGARLTLDHLLGRGHQRLLYWGVERNRRVFSAERRRAAYFSVAAERGIRMEEWSPPSRDPEDDSFADFWRARPTEDRPTAVLCWNDVAAYELLAQCRRRGVRVPADLAVTGFDGDRNPVGFQFSLSTVRAPWAQVAESAVKLLIAQMDGVDVPQRTVLPVEWLAGDTA